MLFLLNERLIKNNTPPRMAFCQILVVMNFVLVSS